MNYIVDMVCIFAFFLIEALQIAFFARAIMSFISPDADGVFAGFVYSITEPFLEGVRLVLDKLGVEWNGFIDFSYTIVVILLSLLSLVIALVM